ncbi:TAR DNA-binding protein 43-like [Hydractinia symbiolongicarpus]|uniref:TAR DNA-binding protein 43-like n=1 Tax=Hydractinia symbiolongicarpus TaxID=13093 RepID=UPI0025512E5C|nr:TAR DNA-binding protein 43-like [Hydractinia symbiolongicarpus]XP_057312352.1 TAR DNA-binding protein 43-like [Hydractinia symbiolongicarpus]XP_057312353.1 TAR DNA-binding protein 43-like [Hydractinia symbiolongicarpus]XP_057312354.1 TAR DNA-binding protein 43-like [Hydractinia symbiolongicarpus]
MAEIDVHEEKVVTEKYPCFVKVSDEENGENCIELPTESCGTILLSTIQAQFPNAIGLKYKSSTGAWRGIRLSDNILDPPFEGWGDTTYHITLPKTDSVKRKMEESPNREPEAKLVKTGSDSDFLSDLIVLGLPYKATEHDMKEYFQQFGELAMHEVKYDPVTKESRGFGFIRFKAAAAAQKALKSNHAILGRRCEVRMPKKKDEMPLKLFIGRLPDGTCSDDLHKYFGDYGELSDVYIPSPFRGFGFVTFASSEIARQVLHMTHSFQGSRINVTYAEPKGESKSRSSNNSASSHHSSGGGSSSSVRHTSRSQDPPFDFEDMRQVMYNNSRTVQTSYAQAYNPYVASSKSPRGTDSRNIEYAYSYPQILQSPISSSVSYSPGDTRAVPQAFWSNNK